MSKQNLMEYGSFYEKFETPMRVYAGLCSRHYGHKRRCDRFKGFAKRGHCKKRK